MNEGNVHAEEGALTLSVLSPAPGARTRRKRLGIGEGSGKGKTCGRGQTGQKSRSGASIPPGFEGGQMPLHRRLPKVGFTSRKKVKGLKLHRVVSLDRLNELAVDGGEITVETMLERGVIRNARQRIKVLGGGELETKMVVHAHAFSASAKKAIENAGGEAKVVK